MSNERIVECPEMMHAADMKKVVNITRANVRWDWIKPSTPTGILNTWNTAPIATKHRHVYAHLTQDAKRFALAQTPSGSLGGGPASFVHPMQ